MGIGNNDIAGGSTDTGDNVISFVAAERILQTFAIEFLAAHRAHAVDEIVPGGGADVRPCVGSVAIIANRRFRAVRCTSGVAVRHVVSKAVPGCLDGFGHCISANEAGIGSDPRFRAAGRRGELSFVPCVPRCLDVVTAVNPAAFRTGVLGIAVGGAGGSHYRHLFRGRVSDNADRNIRRKAVDLQCNYGVADADTGDQAILDGGNIFVGRSPRNTRYNDVGGIQNVADEIAFVKAQYQCSAVGNDIGDRFFFRLYRHHARSRVPAVQRRHGNIDRTRTDSHYSSR